MKYLSSSGIVHRDLRADNVLATMEDDNLIAKISDFGQSRKITPQNKYYFKSGNSIDPIKWSAPEVFEPTPRASSLSDVWAFAILLWEIFTLCRRDPYPELTNSEVKKKVRSGEQMIKYMDLKDFPVGIPQLIENCLASISERRPNFHIVGNKLIEVEKELQKEENNKWKNVEDMIEATISNEGYLYESATIGNTKSPIIVNSYGETKPKSSSYVSVDDEEE